MTRFAPRRRDVMAGFGSAFALANLAWAGQQPASGAVDLDPRLLSRLAAEVVLNGRHRRTFIIDTGAAATSIADSVAAELALPARDPLLVHGTTGVEMTPSVNLDRLLLHGEVFHDLRCPVLSRTELGADGLLGLDVLGRYRISFDMDRRQAGLDVPPSAGAARTRFRPPRNGVPLTRGPLGQLLVSQVGIDGQAVTAFLDSGSQVSVGNLALAAAIDARRPTGSGAVRPPRIHGVAGRAVGSEAEAGVEVRIGEARLADVALSFADLHCFETLDTGGQPALLIGADILSRFRWVVIDFTRDALMLESRSRGSD